MKIPEDHQDLTIAELLPMIAKFISTGAEINIKFTCPNCGSRQTSETPNTLHVLHPDVPYDEMVGNYFCENCGKQVYPKKFGFMLMTGIGGGRK